MYKMSRISYCALFFFFAANFFSLAQAVAGGIGVNWGMMASHPIDPVIVVEMLKENRIGKVKLFDADEGTLRALAGTKIEVMVAIPNDQLAYMSSNLKHARKWVKENVTKYGEEVNIKYVAVGNEPFLASYNGDFIPTTFPALRNIQRSLNEAGLGHRIKATVPINADVYASPSDNPIPSAGNFRSEIRTLMTQIVRYLHSNDAPFVVNIYPFISLYQDPNFPIDYAFFKNDAKPLADGKINYTNVFDANYDTLVSSLKKAGVPNMKIIVGEIGWPTDGDKRATKRIAKRFYDGFLKKVAKNVGTPLRPNGQINAYLFSLFDEDLKSILPGKFERHWGIFSYDGKPKFKIDFTGKGQDKYPIGAKNVQRLDKLWCVFNGDAKESYKYISDSMNYACSSADCTPLGYGCSCSGLSIEGNISYAFNTYFQAMDQDERACDFHGLAKITKEDPSQDNCKFPIQIVSDSSGSGRGRARARMVLVVVMMVVVHFFCVG